MSGAKEAAERGARVERGTVGAFIAWAAGQRWRRILLLTLLCCALFAPGFFEMGPIDRDETRFAQATKQMFESGDFVDIRLQDEPRHNKPIGIYWAQAAAAAFFGGADAEIWAYRIPSLLGALLAVLLTGWAVRPLVGPRAALIAATMMAGLIMLSFEARVAKTDALLLASIVAAQGALARLWFGVQDGPRERGWNIFIFWTALAVGVLIKGPIIALPGGGVILWMVLYDRSLAGLGRLGAGWGAPWLLLLVLPWFIAIGVQTEGGFYLESVGRDLLGKVSTGQEAHGAPPGYYLVAFWGTFWPWTVLALIAAPRVWRWRSAPETAFLLGWLIPTWIVFELVTTKLPHYVLPTYPAIAALAAAAAVDGSARTRGGLFIVAALVWAGPSIALPLFFAVLPNIDLAALPGVALAPNGIVWEPIALAAVALLSFAFAWRYMRAGVWLGFLRAALIGAGAVYWSAYQFAFPAVDAIWTSERMVAAHAPFQACVAQARDGAAGASTPAPLGSVRYHEPSLVFLAGTETELLEPGSAAERLATADGALIWVEGRRDDAFRDAFATVAPEARLQELAVVSGFNYARGKWVRLTLFAREDDPALAGCPAALAGAPAHRTES